LCRKRSLGGGPTSPLQASFTTDEEHMVTMFQVSHSSLQQSSSIYSQPPVQAAFFCLTRTGKR
jgi:hypothetical protein